VLSSAAPDAPHGRSDNLAGGWQLIVAGKLVSVPYGGHPHADAHDSILPKDVDSVSLCRLNLRPKNPEGCQPAYQTTRLPLYDTNGSCTPYLNFSFIT
jgi:hypothetical protein